MEPGEVNEVLQGLKVVSVEQGYTPGWMVINFSVPEEMMKNDVTHLYLTVFVGGRKSGDNGEDNDFWLCALHAKGHMAFGQCNRVRDSRDPDMRMGTALLFTPCPKCGKPIHPDYRTIDGRPHWQAKDVSFSKMVRHVSCNHCNFRSKSWVEEEEGHEPPPLEQP